MARTCTYQWQEDGGRAEWSWDGQALLLVPEQAAPLAFALETCSGIAGDGHGLDLAFGDRRLALQRLGQDGPTLREELGRAWPPARAAALRLTGSGTPRRFQGAWEQRPCAALLYEDALLLAPEGADLQPVFLALLQRIGFDEASYSLRLAGWDGGTLTLGRFAGQTEALLSAARAARAALAREAADLTTRHLPTLPAAARAALSAIWPPGRLVSLADLDQACPGFSRAFFDTWVPASLRVREAGDLLQWAGAAGTWVGFGRPGLGLEGTDGGKADPEGDPPEAAGPGAEPAATPIQPPDCLVWLLCGKGGSWLLETLTEADHATYRFAGGPELPMLASQLLCAPQFSREALHRPMEALTGDRAGLAIPARDLEFLRDLRARFRGRAIHAGADRWRREAGLD